MNRKSVPTLKICDEEYNISELNIDHADITDDKETYHCFASIYNALIYYTNSDNSILKTYYKASCFTYLILGILILTLFYRKNSKLHDDFLLISSILLIITSFISYTNDVWGYFKQNKCIAIFDKIWSTSFSLFVISYHICFHIQASDYNSVLLLLVTLCSALFFLSNSIKSYSIKQFESQQKWHTLWHLSLPVGCFLSFSYYVY
tara:strand:- start:725 stop:1339 length:615 start_codon:yes stop_codon:yes gene_type:complete